MPADSRDMVLVPREPTPDMVRKGAWRAKLAHDANPGDTWEYLARETFAVMLSASPARGEGGAPVAWPSKAERDRAARAVCGANAIMGREPLSEGASYTLADAVIREIAHPTPATPAGDELREKVFAIVEPLVLGLATEFSYPERRAFANKKTDAILAALQPQAEGE